MRCDANDKTKFKPRWCAGGGVMNVTQCSVTSANFELLGCASILKWLQYTRTRVTTTILRLNCVDMGVEEHRLRYRFG